MKVSGVEPFTRTDRMGVLVPASRRGIVASGTGGSADWPRALTPTANVRARAEIRRMG
jgi:hypothetical protein